MILVDANLLLYAYDTGSPVHQAARRWWESLLSGHELVRLAWATVLAFLRIGTHPRVFTAPLSIEEATGHVSSWLEQTSVGVLEPGERHWEILAELLARTQASGNLATDAHLAALAIEHGAVLHSTDQDFRRFAGLAWRDPLASAS